MLTQGALAGVAAAGSVYLLNATPTSQLIIWIAALAGGAGSSLAPLVGSGPQNSLRHRGVTSADPFFSPILFLVLGMITAGTSLVLVLALLVGDAAAQVSKTGSFAFGVIVGLLAGMAVIQSKAAAQSRLARTPLFGALSMADAEIQSRLPGQPLSNYHGRLVAGWFPRLQTVNENSDSVEIDERAPAIIIGSIRVSLVPARFPIANESDAKYLNLPEDRGSSEDSADHRRESVQPRLPKVADSNLVSGRVNIDNGLDEKVVRFTLSIYSSAYAVLPSSFEVLASRDKPTRPVEFRVLRHPSTQSLQLTISGRGASTALFL